MPDVEAALYPTRVTHLHRSPGRNHPGRNHYGEHRSYAWYVDLDALPQLPRWLRPFARFEAVDHFDGDPSDTLRQRVDRFLARNGVFLPGGRITALLMPRVLGRAFNPLSLFWCHDAEGTLCAVVAEVQSIEGRRRAHLLPVSDDGAVPVAGGADNSPFAGTQAGNDGYFLVRAPEPGEALDVRVSLHRESGAAMVATWRGRRRPASAARVLAVQFSAPLAPWIAELGMRHQARLLRWLGAPHPGRSTTGAPDRAVRSAPATAWTANSRSWAPS